MKNKSIWTDNIKKNNSNIDTLENFETDILIIGAGIAGMSTAFHLRDSNKNITIVDASSIGFGVTSKTTAKLTYLQDLYYQKIESNYDFDTSYLYYKSQKKAINIVNDIVSRYNIDCEMEKVDSYLFTNDKNKINKIKKEMDILDNFNVKYKTINNLPIDIPCVYGIKVSDTYVFHPLKYLYSLKEIIKDKINIYENLRVLDIKQDNDNKNYLITTEKNIITANKVLVCTHYPFFLKPGFIPLKTHIERSYVIVTEADENHKFSAITSEKPIHSLRSYNNNLIYGSMSHKLFNHIDYEQQYEGIIKRFQEYFDSKVNYLWMNQDIMTNDYLPYIGIIDKKQPNLLVATGFNTWGMTNGTIAGKVLSDIILERENEFISLFNPLRGVKILNSLINIVDYAKIFTTTTLVKNHSFYPKNVSIIRKNGSIYGVYIDNNNVKHIVNNKCPHMGCNLIFNNKEKTWDCPCHGSRFNIDGKIIEGPSKYSIEVKDIDDF